MIIEHTTLKKWGAGGICLSINATMRKMLDLKEGSLVRVDIEEGKMIVRKDTSPKSIFPFTEEELLEGATRENAGHELLPDYIEGEIPDYE